MPECERCGHEAPQKKDADDGVNAILWRDDQWVCQRCYHMGGSGGGGSRRRGGKGTGGSGRFEL